MRPGSSPWRPKAPKWSPKAHFWEPRAVQIGANSREWRLCENHSICYVFITFSISWGDRFRLQKRAADALRAPSPFFRTFCPPGRAPGRPKYRKVGPKGPQGRPRDPKIAPKSHANRTQLAPKSRFRQKSGYFRGRHLREGEKFV